MGMKNSVYLEDGVFGKLVNFMRKCAFHILSIAPIPTHIPFIMDGNRRYAKKLNLVEGSACRAGLFSLMSMLNYSYELGVRYVTIYAFSIDNFKRDVEETKFLMDLMQEKIEGLIREENIVNRMRVHFVGNLKLLNEPLRLAAERVMAATAKNSRAVSSICVAYSSSNEILHAVLESCEEKWDEIRLLDASGAGYGLVGIGGDVKDDLQRSIKFADIDRLMYMAVAPCPDILIRNSGETRLSDSFVAEYTLLRVFTFCFLPEIGLQHLFWAI